MDREQVLRILREHEAELKAAGVQHLRLFGSVARGHQSPASDIDLAATMNPAKHWTGLTLGGLQMDLSDWLRTQVDFSLLEWFSPRIKERILNEAVDVF